MLNVCLLFTVIHVVKAFDEADSVFVTFTLTHTHTPLIRMYNPQNNKLSLPPVAMENSCFQRKPFHCKKTFDLYCCGRVNLQVGACTKAILKI